MIQQIGIIGYGSWATALVKILTHNKISVIWHFPKQEDIEFILEHHHNPRYLSDVELDLNFIQLTNDLSTLEKKCDCILLAHPSAFLHQSIQKFNFQNKFVVSAVKGIVPEYNLIVGDYLNKVHNIEYQYIGVITGPCHAEEVAMERLSYLTMSSQNIPFAEEFSKLLSCEFIRVTPSDDIYGTEYAAVLKNIMAIAAGICHGLNYGDNFQAVLISNAIQEIKRFVDAVHPINRDINDSAYLGDLLVTAYSQFSRNRTFGVMLGKGYSVKQAQLEMNMIAEGYYALQCVYEINRQYNVFMPITEAVYQIVFGKNKLPVSKIIQQLTYQLK
ncbi:MAG TPA: NAD(P)H-dependent glycerol-3-phosphate dehydrogenase [Bacteroidia bacterium]|nr:NAD(P)H-dependent glycerol-3-phosphate dehydrogenase [Bacteroidia bacterium]